MSKTTTKILKIAAIVAFVGATMGIGAALVGGLSVAEAFALPLIGGLSLGTVAVGSLALLTSGTFKKPSVPNLSQSFGAELQLSGDPVAPRKVAYGEPWTAGTLRYRNATGTDNKELYLVIVLAGHEIDSFTGVRFAEDTLTFDGSGVCTSPAKYAGLVTIAYHLGTDSQTVDTMVNTAFPSEWTSNHRLRGCAYVALKLQFDADKLASIPQMLFKFRGRKVYDRRFDSTNGGSGTQRLADPSTWLWTRTAVVCAEDFMRGVMVNGTMICGMGVAATRFVSANVIAEANVCDEHVTLADSNEELRYTVDGFIDSQQDNGEILRHFEIAMAGDITFSDGAWRFFAGAYRTPTVHLQDDHFIGPIQHTVHVSESARYDTAQGSYASSENEGGVVDYAPVSIAGAVLGSERVLQLDMQLVNDVTGVAGTDHDGGARAQRIAKLLLEREAAGKQIQCTTNLYGLLCVPGETVLVTRSSLGLSAQPMRVMDVQLRFVQDGDKAGAVVDLVLMAGPSSLYAWSAEETVLAAAPKIPERQVPFQPPLTPWTPVLSGITRAGNSFTKTGGTNGAWDAAFSSQDGFDACVVSFRPTSTSTNVLVGLGSRPTLDDSYTSIDFALFAAAGTVQIYESGVSIGTFGTYTTSDQLKVLYDGQNVEYYKNEVLLRRVPRFGARLFADSSFYNIGASVDSVTFNPIGIQRAVLDELRDDFQYPNTTSIPEFYRRWLNRQDAGEISFLTGLGDAPGGSAMRVGDNSGNDEQWLALDRLMPYDGVSLYEIGVLVRKNSGSTNVLYAGLEGVAADGVTLVNSAGLNSYGSQHYIAAANSSPGSSWTTYRGYARGWSGSPVGGIHSDPSAPDTMYTGVAFIRPMVLLNFNAAAGQMDIAAIWVRRLGGVLNALDSLPSAGDDADNMLVNGGGEVGDVGVQATGWTYDNGSAVVPATDEKKFGLRSLKIANGSAIDSFSHQDVALIAGEIYELSAWIKTTALPTGDAGSGAFLNLDAVSGISSFTILQKIGADPNSADPDVGLSATGSVRDWEYVRSRFIANGSNGTVRLYVQLGYGGGQSGTAWFDGVVLRRMEYSETGDLRPAAATNISASYFSSWGPSSSTSGGYAIKLFVEQNGSRTYGQTVSPQSGFGFGNQIPFTCTDQFTLSAGYAVTIGAAGFIEPGDIYDIDLFTITSIPAPVDANYVEIVTMTSSFGSVDVGFGFHQFFGAESVLQGVQIKR